MFKYSHCLSVQNIQTNSITAVKFRASLPPMNVLTAQMHSQTDVFKRFGARRQKQPLRWLFEPPIDSQANTHYIGQIHPQECIPVGCISTAAVTTTRCQYWVVYLVGVCLQRGLPRGLPLGVYLLSGLPRWGLPRRRIYLGGLPNPSPLWTDRQV